MCSIDAFAEHGFITFEHDETVAAWAAHALPVAREIIASGRRRGIGFDCAGTWFVGVDALPNAPDGSVAGSGPLAGRAMDFLSGYLEQAMPPLHRAQLSAVFNGYPKPRCGESEAGFRYRRERDAAHVDGLLPIGPARQRKLREPHAFILALPLTAADDNAAPLALWRGSHHLMRTAFVRALAPQAVARWPHVDLTADYQAARRAVFARCERTTLAARPGEAWILHRHLLHGIAPWTSSVQAPAEGRLIAYFRPEFLEGPWPWLAAP